MSPSPSSRRADVVVVGLGATGSATLAALCARGTRALGLDRHRPPHTLGSTHGRSRIIREAYFESPAYVPLVRRAYEAWDRIARDAGRPLFRRTGGLMLGPAGGELVAGAVRSAEAHGLPYEMLDPPALRRRFPVFAPEDGMVGVLEPRAGFLDPEAAVTSCLELAARNGATVLDQTRVTGWRSEGDSLLLRTDAGPVSCGRLVLATGPWLPELEGGAGLPLEIERQVLGWFAPAGDRVGLGPEVVPVFIWEWERGRFFYGIPDHGPGLKLARHHEGEPTTPDTVDRSLRPDDVAPLERLHRRFLPGRVGPLREGAVCLYTNTPDRHFVLGPHPAEPRVLLASPCSGHGFKFASALGEVLADLATGATPPFDLTPFRPDRFA